MIRRLPQAERPGRRLAQAAQPPDDDAIASRVSACVRRAMRSRSDGRPFEAPGLVFQAWRARCLFVRRELHYLAREWVRGGQGRPLRLLFMGAPPAALLRRGPSGVDAPIEFTLVDRDPTLLEQAARDVLDSRARASVRALAVAPPRLGALGLAPAGRRFDLAVVPFLLDFLPDGSAARVIDVAFSSLTERGELLAAHLCGGLPGTEFDRIHDSFDLPARPRSRAALARLVAATTLGERGRTLGLVRGPNVYLVAEPRARSGSRAG